MKISEKLLEKLIPIALLLAAAAWLAAILLVGVLSKSVIPTVVIIAACAACLFGFYRNLSLPSYSTKPSLTNELLIVAGLILAWWPFSRIHLLWGWGVLCLLQIIPLYFLRQNQINENRRMDAYMAARQPTDAERIRMASQATNLRDYASALGLNYIPARGPAEGPRSVSQFAAHLHCQHCYQPMAAREWPVNGDLVAIYHQKEPGRYSLKLTCPHCGKDWYVVWDQDPGPIRPLA
jgi:hypothetical protein